VTEAGCLAPPPRSKVFDLHAANQSQIAELTLMQFARVYEIERAAQQPSGQ
jgi:transposase